MGKIKICIISAWLLQKPMLKIWKSIQKVLKVVWVYKIVLSKLRTYCWSKTKKNNGWTNELWKIRKVQELN